MKRYYIGDLLIRSLNPLVDHYGIVVGPLTVLDIKKSRSGRARVRLVSIDKFASGHQIRVERRPPGVSDAGVLARAGAVLTAHVLHYDFLLHNCEHLSRWIQRGSSESKQVQSGVLGILTGIGLGLVIVAVTSDETV